MDKITLANSITTKDDSNILTVGSCRTGKTRYFVKPNLLTIKDSVIISGRKGDKLFEDTAEYRKENFKQKIFTNKDFTKDKKNLDFLGDDYTVYLTASVIDIRERLLLLRYDFNWIMYHLNNKPPKKPVTIIIDDLSLFPICAYHFIPKIDNLRIIAIVQSIHEIIRYDKNPEETLNLFPVKVFFGVPEQYDVQYIIHKYNNEYNKKIPTEEIMQLPINERIIFGVDKNNPIHGYYKR